MTRYAPDYGIWEARPRRPDWETVPGRTVGRGRRLAPLRLGKFCDPADCKHPIEARVWPDVGGFVAACHDCGKHIDRRGEWRAA